MEEMATMEGPFHSRQCSPGAARLRGSKAQQRLQLRSNITTNLLGCGTEVSCLTFAPRDAPELVSQHDSAHLKSLRHRNLKRISFRTSSNRAYNAESDLAIVAAGRQDERRPPAGLLMP